MVLDIPFAIGLLKYLICIKIVYFIQNIRETDRKILSVIYLPYAFCVSSSQSCHPQGYLTGLDGNLSVEFNIN